MKLDRADQYSTDEFAEHDHDVDEDDDPYVFWPVGDSRIEIWADVDEHELQEDGSCHTSYHWVVRFDHRHDQTYRWDLNDFSDAESLIRSFWTPFQLSPLFHCIWLAGPAASELRRSIQEMDPAVMNAAISLANLHGHYLDTSRVQALDMAWRCGVFSSHPPFDPMKEDTHEYDPPTVDLTTTTWYGKVIDRWLSAEFRQCRDGIRRDLHIRSMIDGVKKLDRVSICALSDWMEEKNWPQLAAELFPARNDLEPWLDDDEDLTIDVVAPDLA